MSGKIEWSDEYLLGILEIDNQHKKLVAIANELYDITTGNSEIYKLEMSKVLKKLTPHSKVYRLRDRTGICQGYWGICRTVLKKSWAPRDSQIR